MCITLGWNASLVKAEHYLCVNVELSNNFTYSIHVSCHLRCIGTSESLWFLSDCVLQIEVVRFTKKRQANHLSGRSSLNTYCKADWYPQKNWTVCTISSLTMGTLLISTHNTGAPEIPHLLLKQGYLSWSSLLVQTSWSVRRGLITQGPVGYHSWLVYFTSFCFVLIRIAAAIFQTILRTAYQLRVYKPQNSTR